MPSNDPSPSPIFVTTRWSVVLAAQDEISTRADVALETLCRTYWYPIYAYVRRSGCEAHDAQDLTQEFFARLLARKWLQAAVRERGRFRTFLLVALKRFLANEWHQAMAQKRGGGATLLTLDTADAEQRYAGEPVLTPDQIFDRRWAITLLEQTLELLCAEFIALGKGREFDVLKDWLTAARGEIPYGELAVLLHTTEGAARVGVHRLRRRFRELFRENIEQTVAEPAAAEEEIRYLVSVLGGGV